MVSALAKRKRMGDLAEEQVAFIQSQFFNHCKAYQILMIGRDVTRIAIELLNKYPLRAYDAVQLGTALMAQQKLTENGISLIFVCADHTLCQTAKKENLLVKNPLEEELAGC